MKQLSTLSESEGFCSRLFLWNKISPGAEATVGQHSINHDYCPTENDELICYLFELPISEFKPVAINKFA